VTYSPHTPWERLPKWARVLLGALIVVLGVWLINALARCVAGASVDGGEQTGLVAPACVDDALIV
jgi:hypothetical protein